MFDLLVNPRQVNEALNKLLKDGKVKYFGLSNHSPLEFDTMQKYADVKFVTHQFMLNPLGIENYKNGTMTHSLKEGVHPMIWSPLAGGRIFNPVTDFEKNMKNTLEEIREELRLEHIDEVIYKWVLKHSSEPVIVVGSGNRERIQRAIKAIKGREMTKEQWYKIMTEAGYVFW